MQTLKYGAVCEKCLRPIEAKAWKSSYFLSWKLRLCLSQGVACDCNKAKGMKRKIGCKEYTIPRQNLNIDLSTSLLVDVQN